MARKSLSKKVRFEVFKRDAFTCSYCGKSPPEATLEVDHIVPVSGGGSSEIDNLVTACFACNRGKSDRPLELAPCSIVKKAEIIREREEQLIEYQKVLSERQARLDEEALRIMSVYSDLAMYEAPPDARRSVVRFIDELGFFVVKDAMEYACLRNNGGYASWKYFCGICWNKIRAIV